mgnify:CR=1 FL=1
MVQTIPPFGIAAFVWDPEDLEIGKYKYRQALQTVAECREKGLYPGYDAYAESGNFWAYLYETTGMEHKKNFIR